jgi:hypothetical protein
VLLIVESARLRAALYGIRVRLWAASSNERRVPLRGNAGDSLDRPATDASLRLGRSLRGEERREVDNAKCRQPPCSSQVNKHRMKGKIRSSAPARLTWYLRTENSELGVGQVLKNRINIYSFLLSSASDVYPSRRPLKLQHAVTRSKASDFHATAASKGTCPATGVPVQRPPTSHTIDTCAAAALRTR